LKDPDAIQDFAEARVDLPLRFYNKSGLLASRLYVEAEYEGEEEVDNVYDSLLDLRDEFDEYPELLSFFLNAANTPQQKSTLFARLGTLLEFPTTLSIFLDYLSKTRTSKDIIKIIESYESLVKARDQVVDVTLTIAHPDQPIPNSEDITDALDYDEDIEVNLEVIVDPSIEGGVILASKDRYLDHSFRKVTSVHRQKLELEARQKRSQKRTEFLQELAKYPNSVHP
jgi:F0F1-type ATP synthase delta subunit